MDKVYYVRRYVPYSAQMRPAAGITGLRVRRRTQPYALTPCRCRRQYIDGKFMAKLLSIIYPTSSASPTRIRSKLISFNRDVGVAYSASDAGRNVRRVTERKIRMRRGVASFHQNGG